MSLPPLLRNEHYPHAPIKEALIDLQLEPSERLTVSGLEKLREQVKSEFPTCRKLGLFEGKFSGGANLQASAKQEDTGFIYDSSDKKHVLQTRINGFTFSRLAPYDTWESLRDQARHYWNLYLQHVGDVAIHRVAVRYINQIDIPSSKIDIDEYFQTAPRIGAQLPQGLNKFQLQVEAPLLEINSNALVLLTQVWVPPISPDHVSVVLDIDVFAHGLMIGEREAWDLLEALRVRKNDYFEGSITEKTRELFR